MKQVDRRKSRKKTEAAARDLPHGDLDCRGTKNRGTYPEKCAKMRARAPKRRAGAE